MEPCGSVLFIIYYLLFINYKKYGHGKFRKQQKLTIAKYQ